MSQAKFMNTDHVLGWCFVSYLSVLKLFGYFSGIEAHMGLYLLRRPRRIGIGTALWTWGGRQTVGGL